MGTFARRTAGGSPSTNVARRQSGGSPSTNVTRSLITGMICGDRVQDIEEPLKREVRYLDKLIDELAKGKAMEKILRQPA